jgi:hypothetical protein
MNHNVRWILFYTGITGYRKPTWPRVKIGLGYIIAALLLAWVLGCSTRAAKPTQLKKPSFDPIPDATGNYENSGVLGITNHEFIVTPNFMYRYNAFVAKWGSHFMPPLIMGEGLSPWCTNGSNVIYLMDKAHMDKMATMTVWQSTPPVVLAPKPP